MKSSKNRTPKGPTADVDPMSFKGQLQSAFMLSYRQRMTCAACGVARDLHSQQNILGPLSLGTNNNGRKDISACLKQFFSSDAWEVKCENRKCLRFNKPKFKNRVTQSIVAAPDVLMIQFKCFNNTGNKVFKKSPNISYGHELELSDFASNELLEDEGSLEYKLSSVVIHQGSSLESGHYVGVFTGPSGQIHHISDETVRKCSSDALLPGGNMKGTPYILCYTRARAGWKPPKTKR